MFYLEDNFAVDADGVISESAGSVLLIETRLVETTSDGARHESATAEVSRDLAVPNGGSGVPDRIVRLIEPVATFERDGMQYRSYHVGRDVSAIAAQGVVYATTLDKYAVKKYNDITYLTAIPVSIPAQTLFDRVPLSGDMPADNVPLLAFDHFNFFRDHGGLTVNGVEVIMVDPPLIGRGKEFMPINGGELKVQRGAYLYPHDVYGPKKRDVAFAGFRLMKDVVVTGKYFNGEALKHGAGGLLTREELAFAFNQRTQSYIAQSQDICGNVQHPKMRFFPMDLLASYMGYLYGTNRQAYRTITLVCDAEARLYETKL